MTNTINTLQRITPYLFALALVGVVFLAFGETRVRATDASVIPAVIATTSTNTITTSQQLVFATSTCGSRIVSTGASAVMIGFSDRQGFLPTGVVGHLQGASTTVAYDAGLYGCGAMRIYSYASQLVTVSETR